MHLADDHPILLKLTQLLGQHLLRGVGQAFAQFAETLRPLHEVINDDGLPFPADDFQGSANGTFFEAHGFEKVANAQNSAFLPESP